MQKGASQYKQNCEKQQIPCNKWRLRKMILTLLTFRLNISETSSQHSVLCGQDDCRCRTALVRAHNKLLVLVNEDGALAAVYALIQRSVPQRPRGARRRPILRRPTLYVSIARNVHVLLNNIPHGSRAI